MPHILPYRLLEIFTASVSLLKMHKTAALICLQTHHIWSVSAAEVSKSGLVPQNVAEVPTGQPAYVPSHCLIFQCSNKTLIAKSSDDTCM